MQWLESLYDEGQGVDHTAMHSFRSTKTFLCVAMDKHGDSIL